MLLLAIFCKTGKNEIIITELGNLVIKTFKPLNLLGRGKHCATFRALENKKKGKLLLKLSFRDGLAHCISYMVLTSMF